MIIYIIPYLARFFKVFYYFLNNLLLYIILKFQENEAFYFLSKIRKTLALMFTSCYTDREQLHKENCDKKILSQTEKK